MREPPRATSHDAVADSVKPYRVLSSQYKADERNRTPGNAQDANDFTIDEAGVPRRSFYIVTLAISLHFLFVLNTSGFRRQEGILEASPVWLHDAICTLFANTRCLGLR